jgi:hypothetical protein
MSGIRSRQQDHEECELDVIQSFAVDIRLDQPGDDVVDEVAASLFLCGGNDFACCDGELLLERGDRPRREKP